MMLPLASFLVVLSPVGVSSFSMGKSLAAVLACKHAGGQPELDSAQGWRQLGLLICNMLLDLFPAERLRQTA